MVEVMGERETGTAALRDPATVRNDVAGVRYHVLVRDIGRSDGVVAACGAGARVRNGNALLLDEQVYLAEVPDELRCQRDGCGQRWPDG